MLHKNQIRNARNKAPVNSGRLNHDSVTMHEVKCFE